MKARTKGVIAACSAAGVLVGARFAAENLRVDAEEIPVLLEGLPEELEGLRIVHVSDLHLPRCGRSPHFLAGLVRRLRPDLIFLTGDLIDRHRAFPGEQLAELAEALAAVAPCYAVAGNHEFRAGVFEEWRRILENAGIRVLDDEWVTVTMRGASFRLGGLSYGIPSAPPRGEGCCLVLSHYPTGLAAYAHAGYDLVFAGHAHGGQVRVFGHGLLAPGEGVLPRYTSGLYPFGKTQMVVSRGLRSGWFPPRVENRPHLPVVVLERSGEGAGKMKRNG